MQEVAPPVSISAFQLYNSLVNTLHRVEALVDVRNELSHKIVKSITCQEALLKLVLPPSAFRSAPGRLKNLPQPIKKTRAVVPWTSRVLVYGQSGQSVQQVADSFYGQTHIERPLAVLECGYENFNATYPFLCTDWKGPLPLDPFYYFPSQVLPDSSLFLGGIDSRECFVLSALQITHVVSLIEDPWEEEKKLQCSSVKGFLWCDVCDTARQDMTQHFAATFKFIDDARASGGKVLVHCAAGLSRSPTVVIAWLMHTNNWSATRAIHTLHEVRSVIPNQGFLRQLKTFEESLGFSSLQQFGDRVTIPPVEALTQHHEDVSSFSAEEECSTF